MFNPCELEDQFLMQKELDKVKADVFRGKNSAFFGPLLCTLEFIWTRDMPTAATNGSYIWWNPDWFLSLPPKTRSTILVHELWHIARLHGLRCGDRDAKYWNYACDIFINNELIREGYTFDGIKSFWKDPNWDKPDATEEDIYDWLMKNKVPPPPQGPFGDNSDGDLEKQTEPEKRATLQNVVTAQQAAKRTNNAGDIPGNIEKLISSYLSPIIPWEQYLYRWMTDLLNWKYSMRRPNRGYQHVYLPSIVKDEGRLEHLIYYLDVSGSVTDEQVLRFNSEVKHIKDVYKPKKLTLVQFDTRITKEIVFEENDPFEAIPIIGRGGTDLSPVHAHIMEHKPTAAVIFSDLFCNPMDAILDIPILWVAISNRAAKVNCGQLIHIKG